MKTGLFDQQFSKAEAVMERFVDDEAVFHFLIEDLKCFNFVIRIIVKYKCSAQFGAQV